MVEIITDPGVRFQRALKQKDWARPLFVFLIATGITATVVFYLYIVPNPDLILARLADRGLTPEQIDEVATRLTSTEGLVFSVIQSLIATAIRIFITTLFFFLTLILLEQKQRFVDVLTITTNASLIGIVGYLIRTPLLIITRREPATGFGLLVSETNTFLARFLYRLDLFAGWEVTILILGLALLTRSDWRRLAVIIIPCWILYNLVMAHITSRL